MKENTMKRIISEDFDKAKNYLHIMNRKKKKSR
jgi:hypothetical protein